MSLRNAPIALTVSDTPPSVVDDIQSQILQRICLLQYQAGQQLKEAEIAKEFGVSRTPVRDAISRISHLGLVETRNGVGTVVVALSPDVIRQVYEMRLHLATLIGDMESDPISELHRQQARSLMNDAKKLLITFDLSAYVLLNHQLNNLIAELIGNIVLRSFWRQTYYQAASTWHELGKISGDEVARAFVDELTEVNAALDANDIKAVGYVQRIHIGYGYNRLKDWLLRPVDQGS